MSFMSVPLLDRLLEPSKTESTSIQLGSTKADRRSVMNMSPLFSSQSHDQLSPPQSRPSLPYFSPTPYVLNFKRQVFDSNGTSNGIGETSRYELDVTMQPTSDQVNETTSFRGESKVLADLKNKVIDNKTMLNDDKILPIREVQDHFSLGRKSWEIKERSQVKNIYKSEKLMTNPVEAICNGNKKQESGRGLRSQNPSIGQHDMDISSISLPNREEFFDAREEPFEDTSSDEDNMQAKKLSKTIFGGRRDIDRYLKLQLDQEIKRRMAAEDAMAVLQHQCIDMASHLTFINEEFYGLDDSSQHDWDSDFQVQKLVVAQVVACSVTRGAMRAEIGEEMDNVVVEKNCEIARLQDKLHYYELVNHEMSQRNQKAFELARKRRHIKQNRNQWLMVCAGSAFCVGVSVVLVYKFAPWATLHFPSKSVMQSHMQTNVYHSSPSHDI